MFGFNDQPWAEEALCRSWDPDTMFVERIAQRMVKENCNPCPVKYECAGYALDKRIPYGVWGGLTERDRERAWKTEANTLQPVPTKPPLTWGKFFQYQRYWDSLPPEKDQK